MKNIKIQFKMGAYIGGFRITPCIQITYSDLGYTSEFGFAIEITWGKWGIGCRFYRDK